MGCGVGVACAGVHLLHVCVLYMCTACVHLCTHVHMCMVCIHMHVHICGIHRFHLSPGEFLGSYFSPLQRLGWKRMQSLPSAGSWGDPQVV